MPSRLPSRASPSSGFVPLPGSARSDMADMADIPLTAVRNNASTVAGRKPYESPPTADEKDELRRRHAGRRRKMGGESLRRSGSCTVDDVSVNALGRLYARVVGFSPVTRYLVYIVPVGILLAAPLIVLAVTGHKADFPVGSGTDSDSGAPIQGPPLFNLFLWIQVTWLSLWAAKIASWFLPKGFTFFCGIVSMGVRKYATILSNLTIPLSLFFSAMASYLTFKHVFQPASAAGIGWVVALERVLGALFVSSAVLLAEKTIVQLIGVSYHQRSFANRIKASKREIHLLGMLYDASRTLFPMYCTEFAEEDHVINDSIEMTLRKKSNRLSSGAATPIKIIGDVSRFGDKVTSVFGNFAQEITGKQVFNPTSTHSIILEALEKRLPSEALGRRIWMSFVLEDEDALYPEDFHDVLGPACRDEADEAFSAIDHDLNGDISLDEMVRKVVDIGKERKAIVEGMKDIGQALRVFDQICLFVVLLIVIFVFLAFFRSSFVEVIASAGTALLSLSFVFAVTAQEFLGSCIFLFVKHPYDVGDRVDISQVQMVVDRISLLYSVFTRIDTMQVVQVPNIQLNTLWIDNISRSKAMVETIELEVSYDTTFEDIELLRLEMEKFVRSPENSRDFQRDFNIGVAGVGSLDKMVLNINIKHKSNWHNDGVRATRRSKFMCALALALKKIPIYGPGGGIEALGDAKNPSYAVAVTDEFAAAARDEAAREKEAARMVPTHANQTDEEAREAEEHAVTELNTRHHGIDTQGLWGYGNREDRKDPSHDGRRSKDIESVRNVLLRRASTRGRRRAGSRLGSVTMSNINNPEWEILTSGRFDGFLWSGADADDYTPAAEPTGKTAAGGYFANRPSMSPGPRGPSRNTTSFSPYSRGTTPASFVSLSSSGMHGGRQPVSNDEEMEMAAAAEIEREIYAGMETLEDAFEKLHHKAEMVRTALRQRGAGQHFQNRRRIDVLSNPGSGNSQHSAYERPPWAAGSEGEGGTDDEWALDDADIMPDDSASNISSSRHRRPKRRTERRTPAPIEEDEEE